MHFDSLPPQLNLPDEFEPGEPRDIANRRLWGGIIISLALHALILSLQFGIPGLDIPSLELPWKERRNAVEALQVQIANPAPAAKPAPAAPAVTVTELFKLPEPILPNPVPKTNGGLVVLPSPPPAVPPKGQNKPSVKQARAVMPRVVPSAPPLVKKVLPPPEAPVRIIAQDQVKNDEFVVPLASEEELERKREDRKDSKRQVEPVPADAVIDKDAETQLIEEQKRAELAAKKVQEELQLKKQEEKLRQLAEQKRQEELRVQQEIAKANEEQQKKLAKLIEDNIRKPTDIVPIEPVREINEQKQLAKQRAAQELAKREQEQALEEALREAKRQELLAQETLRKEEQRRQAEQQRQRQLALEQEQQRQAAAQLRQQQLAEQERLEKLQALAVAEKKAQEQKQLEQKLAEQKLAEQKLAEQKIQEQKLAEQRIAEQRAQEQRLAEQRAVEQKLAEQRLADQKLAERRVAERAASEKAAAEAAVAKAIAERLAAQSAQGSGNGNNSSGNSTGSASTANGTGTGNVGNTTNNPVQSLSSGDLTSRLRDQARGGDLLKPRMPLTKGVEDNQRARRRSFLGAYDKEVPLRMYIDSVKAKAERNGNLIYEKRSLSSAEYAVILSIVIKSDGSLEEVSILRSSGNRSIDERARNIAMTNAPYSAFPPALAAKYDVIELKHFWVFGDRLRILDDLPQF